ncbi:anti-silencing protein a-like protein, putative [Bodo saltans]|uniref:Anti-silencing protein a-like protein, putative n=1 Tax=Bodo saltans TaxID=75058 RepID=A0A0S4JR86_BODSA|nr:anti-silencing protein a-like protein, putative [Bodo saltans]|eukprot:CUG91583.1 anti-silencing protein a-like protein, putative [Bodo saltans]
MPTRVELVKVEVIGENPDQFDEPFTLRIVLNVLEDPPKGTVDVKFTWSPIWDFPVDQELDELEVGPLSTIGQHELVLECDPPQLSKIPDPTGQTALMVSLQYNKHEFLHLGFSVETHCILEETPEEYTDPSTLRRKIGRCFPKATEIAWDAALLGELNEQTLQELAAHQRSGTQRKSERDDFTSDEDDEDGGDISDSGSAKPAKKPRRDTVVAS